ncbi:MAG TPA: Ig-like domain repeat protein, partial [Candidatus Sulfotelmatobacter sp.]|nr:Ig-like domain repeat protein [Candidatus Sulfotelmatobacter sp.]
HNRIVMVNSAGTASVLAIAGLSTAINQPAALALDGAGNLYIADWGNSRIVKVSPAGVGVVVGTGSYPLAVSGVTGVAVDPSGNIYIADRVANHIVKVTASGVASLVSVAGLTLSNPQGVATDGNGNLYIVDSGHRRVVQITAAGTASVVQTPGVTLGTIMYGVTVDSGGNVYAVDWSNNRLTRVNVGGAALSFANTTIGATSTDSPKTAMVTNLGNEALVFRAAPVYTPDFSENGSDANPCTSSTSLDPGEACDVSVLFTPQSAASLSTNVVVADNHLNSTNATQNVAVSGTGLSPITTTIVWAQPSAISYGTSLSSILNADATDGTSPVTGTYAYTATPTGGSASTVTATTILAAGDYVLSVSFSPDSVSHTSATGSVSLAVNKAAPSVALESSGSPALVSTSVTLTATVSSSVSTPTGSVDFYDGTTLLGSGTLASGVATYTTSSLAAGTHSITAAYGGDSNFSSVTSSAVSQVVADVTLAIASGGTSTATVSAGGTATYHLNLAPSNGSTFPAAVTLSASGGPAGSTITVSPQTIAAGAAATDVTVTVQVPAAAAAMRSSHAWILATLMGMLALPFGMGRKRSYKQVLVAALLLIGVASTGNILGCGSGHTTSTTRQPTNYTVTVTATSGSVSHSTALTLTVQ